MNFSGEGQLISVTVPMVNGIAQKPVQAKTPVWYDEKSIRQSEFYAASAQGVKLEKMVEIRSEDWGGQTRFEDENGICYKIFRAYDPKKGKIELTLQTE